MAKLTILEIPDPRLKAKAVPVDKVDASLARLMEDMLETMYAAPGVGLAAPQVGVLQRVIVVDIARDGEPRTPLRMANPVITWASDAIQISNEGCLSVPEQYADVERPERIRVRYIDHQNEIREVDAADMLATVILHEMDHLDGVLFVDRISKLKRNIVLRRLFKSRKTKPTADVL